MVALLALALLVSSSFMQRKLNLARSEMGYTRVTPLKNAPPVLVFTTVVLGGFRGLIANALWIRAMELQDEDKFFEMVQLADWITKLQPHFKTVWIVQAWNMAYNISVKFSDPPDRYQWVMRGVELLRDEALKYNPNEVLLYRELGWFFQHKMGHNLDDAHLYYKSMWASKMHSLFDGGRPDFDQLISPKTDVYRKRAEELRQVYKMDPGVMKEVDTQYGPLDWRLPEAHAIYWAFQGRKQAKTKEDMITLRRVIYQSMQLAFQRGRLIRHSAGQSFEFGPNLDIIDKTNAAYEEQMADDVEMRQHIAIGHRNFLLDAVYFLYIHSRRDEANRWLDVIKKKYPDRYEPGLSLDEYAVSRVSEDAGETDMNKTVSNIYAILQQSYRNLTIGEYDQANGLAALAKSVWARYMRTVQGDSLKRVGLPPLEQMKQEVVNRLLDPENGLPPELQGRLRSELNLPAAPSGTNAVPLMLQPPTN